MPQNNPFSFPEGYGANNDYGYGFPSGQSATDPNDPNDFKNPFSGANAPTVVGQINNQPDISAQSWSQKLFPNGVSGDDFLNLGKAALGIYGAVQPIPTDTKSNAWNSYLQRMQTLSNEGLTPEEYSLANRNATNAYASDLNAIRSGSGGNASTYLANAGRAADSLYNDKAKIAVADADLRRQNLERYGSALTQDNQYNRQLFLDKYNQALENKKAGAALASDALYNIHNQGMFNKQYGAGSPYAQWIQAQVDKEKAATAATKGGQDAFQNYLDWVKNKNTALPSINPLEGQLYPGIPQQGVGAYVTPINNQ